MLTTSTVISGVVAFINPAITLLTWVSAYAKRNPGPALRKSATTAK